MESRLDWGRKKEKKKGKEDKKIKGDNTERMNEKVT